MAAAAASRRARSASALLKSFVVLVAADSVSTRSEGNVVMSSAEARARARAAERLRQVRKTVAILLPATARVLAVVVVVVVAAAAAEEGMRKRITLTP